SGLLGDYYWRDTHGTMGDVSLALKSPTGTAVNPFDLWPDFRPRAVAGPSRHSARVWGLFVLLWLLSPVAHGAQNVRFQTIEASFSPEITFNTNSASFL